MLTEFENKLASELSDLGIYAQHNYQVPGTKLTIDFYIKGEGEIGFVNLFKNLNIYKARHCRKILRF